MISKLASVLVSLTLINVVVWADSDEGFETLMADDRHWEESAKGLSIAVIEGNPSSEGFYIIHARFDSGVMSAPHIHPNDRYVTVLSGTWWAGTGIRENRENALALRPGSFMKHPAGKPHYDGSMEGEVIVEIKGMGPAPIMYLDENGTPYRQD